jgi:hypothetical protein
MQKREVSALGVAGSQILEMTPVARPRIGCHDRKLPGAQGLWEHRLQIIRSARGWIPVDRDDLDSDRIGLVQKSANRELGPSPVSAKKRKNN